MCDTNSKPKPHLTLTYTLNRRLPRGHKGHTDTHELDTHTHELALCRPSEASGAPGLLLKGLGVGFSLWCRFRHASETPQGLVYGVGLV